MIKRIILMILVISMIVTAAMFVAAQDRVPLQKAQADSSTANNHPKELPSTATVQKILREHHLAEMSNVKQKTILMTLAKLTILALSVLLVLWFVRLLKEALILKKIETVMAALILLIVLNPARAIV